MRCDYNDDDDSDLRAQQVTVNCIKTELTSAYESLLD